MTKHEEFLTRRVANAYESVGSVVPIRKDMA